MERTAQQTATTTTGRIDAVNLADGKATVTHEPIPALGWPAMTMDFSLDDGLDASNMVAGSRVAFDFVDRGSGVFAIVGIRPLGDGPENEAAAEPEAWTVAKINGPGASDGQVNVTHEPIPALGWPAMTMDLGVDAAIAPDMIAPGKRLRIGLAKGADGLYRIVAAEPDTGGS